MEIFKQALSIEFLNWIMREENIMRDGALIII